MANVIVAWRRRRLYRGIVRSPLPVLVFRYHSVGDPEAVGHYLDPGLSLTPRRFAEQMDLIARNFQVISPAELPQTLEKEAGSRKTALITFDDGYRDNHDQALPLLRAAGLPATFFVTSQPLGSGRGLWISELWRLIPRLPPGPTGLSAPAPSEIPVDPESRIPLRRSLTAWMSSLPAPAREQALDTLAELAQVPRGEGLEKSFMTPEHLRSLCAQGMTVGAHTRSHPHLDRLDPVFHEEEVAGAKSDLEKILGSQVTCMAYPNPGGGGAIGPKARESVEAAGFRIAFTSLPGAAGRDTDLLRFPRLGVYAGPQEKTLFSVLSRIRRPE